MSIGAARIAIACIDKMVAAKDIRTFMAARRQFDSVHDQFDQNDILQHMIERYDFIQTWLKHDGFTFPTILLSVGTSAPGTEYTRPDSPEPGKVLEIPESGTPVIAKAEQVPNTPRIEGPPADNAGRADSTRRSA